MRAQEFLRSLLSVLDAIESDEQKQPPVVININGGEVAQSAQPEKTGDDEQISSDTGDMIPPLQQEIEMMKKIAGLTNAYDDAAGVEQPSKDLSNGEKMVVMKNISQTPMG
jgi:hypothetical protein